MWFTSGCCTFADPAFAAANSAHHAKDREMPPLASCLPAFGSQGGQLWGLSEILLLLDAIAAGKKLEIVSLVRAAGNPAQLLIITWTAAVCSERVATGRIGEGVASAA